jgi:hypothetical protein
MGHLRRRPELLRVASEFGGLAVRVPVAALELEFDDKLRSDSSASASAPSNAGDGVGGLTWFCRRSARRHQSKLRFC